VPVKTLFKQVIPNPGSLVHHYIHQLFLSLYLTPLQIYIKPSTLFLNLLVVSLYSKVVAAAFYYGHHQADPHSFPCASTLSRSLLFPTSILAVYKALY
jgi:hypothetical protein